MKTKAVSMIALFLVAASAHADINGFWSGNYSETGSDGSSSVNAGFLLGISTAAGAITFCEPMGFTFLDGLTFQEQGGNLMLNGHLAGWVGTSTDGTTLTLLLTDDIDGLFDEVSVTANLDGSLSYTDYFADYWGDYIDGNSIAQSCQNPGHTTHAARGTLLKNFFSNLKKKTQPQPQPQP